MTQQDIYDFIRANIKCKVGSAGKQLITVCPMSIHGDCTDKSGHLYIGPFRNTDEPVFYNCFKCGFSGIVTEKFLSLFDIQDNEFNKALSEYNKNSDKTIQNKTGKIKQFNIINDYITNCRLSEQKLAYINNRLGLQLTYKDLIDKKIVLNLFDLLKRNNIEKLTRDERIVSSLNHDFIGFIASDNNHVNMRNLAERKVHPSIDKKYINYNIFSGDIGNKYYILPTNIDLSSPEKIMVHIAEGPFDVLGIYYNVMNQYDYRSIYAGGTGKGYIGLIEYLICDLGLFNIELHIYPDLDISQNDMIDLGRYLSVFNIDIFIHRNLYKNKNGEQEKDFGVPRDRIINSTLQIQRKRK